MSIFESILKILVLGAELFFFWDKKRQERFREKCLKWISTYEKNKSDRERAVDDDRVRDLPED